MGKRIGIMGGTFDPIHNGHLIMAEDALEAFELDEVLFMPSGHSYFKDHRDVKVSSSEDRFNMTEAAISGNPSFGVSDIEIRRSGNTYTCETMEQLKKESPDADLFFICGADSVIQMKQWYHPERLFAACSILTAIREDEIKENELQDAINELEIDYGAVIKRIPARNIEISSTEIRRRIRDGRSVRYLIPEKVANYIELNGLYR